MIDEEPVDEERIDAEDDDDSGYVPRVVVKFNDGEHLPYEDRLDRVISDRYSDQWEQLPEEFRDIAINRLFSSVSPERIDELVREAGERPNYLAYFSALIPPEASPEALVEVFASWPFVETAYVEAKPILPPLVIPRNDPVWPKQGYHKPARDGGIDVGYAWRFGGGDGKGIAFVDIERGWTLNHQDLVGKAITIISGHNRDCLWHGTAVLGIVVGEDNDRGVVGIAPGASARVVSQWRTKDATTSNIADAILSANDVLTLGDVLLLEAQKKVRHPTTGHKLKVPVEIDEAIFKAIRVATGRGVVVVEAAGNGDTNLGRFDKLNRNHPTFQDSFAIMVGAAFHDTRKRWEDPKLANGSNYGSRVDCYAWGDGIATCGKDPTDNAITDYTDAFGGTSGASAIIAGAALVVQGIAQHLPGGRLVPDQLRARFSNPTLGTLSHDPGVDCIGPMPNLRAIIEDLPGTPQLV